MANYYVLWSGGLDSTYLIQSLLEQGHNVKAGYVALENNDRKTKMELKAVNALAPILQDKFRQYKFEFLGKVYSVDIGCSNKDVRLIQVPIWLNAAFLTIPNPETYGFGNCIHHVAIGYVMNDCAISYLDEIRAIWKSYNSLQNTHAQENYPTIEFPLIKYDKDELWNYLDTDLRPHVVWCENPQGPKFKPCKECNTCKRAVRQAFILKEPPSKQKELYLNAVTPFGSK